MGGSKGGKSDYGYSSGDHGYGGDPGKSSKSEGGDGYGSDSGKSSKSKGGDGHGYGGDHLFSKKSGKSEGGKGNKSGAYYDDSSHDNRPGGYRRNLRAPLTSTAQ